MNQLKGPGASQWINLSLSLRSMNQITVVDRLHPWPWRLRLIFSRAPPITKYTIFVLFWLARLSARKFLRISVLLLQKYGILAPFVCLHRRSASGHSYRDHSSCPPIRLRSLRSVNHALKEHLATLDESKYIYTSLRSVNQIYPFTSLTESNECRSKAHH